jgi:hypothetical protein
LKVDSPIIKDGLTDKEGSFNEEGEERSFGEDGSFGKEESGRHWSREVDLEERCYKDGVTKADRSKAVCLERGSLERSCYRRGGSICSSGTKNFEMLFVEGSGIKGGF